QKDLVVHDVGRDSQDRLRVVRHLDRVRLDAIGCHLAIGEDGSRHEREEWILDGPYEVRGIERNLHPSLDGASRRRESRGRWLEDALSSILATSNQGGRKGDRDREVAPVTRVHGLLLSSGCDFQDGLACRKGTRERRSL